MLAQDVEAFTGFCGSPQPVHAFALVVAGGNLIEVDLVDQHHALDAGGQGIEERQVGGVVGGGGDQQGDVGALQFSVGATHTFAFDFVFRFAQAGGVGQFQRDAVET